MMSIRTILAPTFAKTRETIFINGFSNARYLITPASSILFNGAYGGAPAACRSNLELLGKTALYLAGSHTEIKDWDVGAAGQMENLVTQAWTSADLLANLNLQYQARRLVPAATKDDDTFLWTEESWTNFITSLVNVGWTFPAFSYVIAARLSWMRTYSPPYVQESIVPGYFIPVTPWMHLAHAEQARDTLPELATGGIHARKASIPMVRFNPGMIRGCRVYSETQNIAHFWRWFTTVHVYNGVSWDEIPQQGNPAAAAHSQIPIIWNGNAVTISNQYSLLPLLSKYHATNNAYGALYEAPEQQNPANFEINWYCCPYTGSFQQGLDVQFTDGFLNYHRAQSANTGADHAVINSSVFTGPDGLSKSVWDKMFETFLVRAWLGDLCDDEPASMEQQVHTQEPVVNPTTRGGRPRQNITGKGRKGHRKPARGKGKQPRKPTRNQRQLIGTVQYIIQHCNGILNLVKGRMAWVLMDLPLVLFLLP